MLASLLGTIAASAQAQRLGNAIIGTAELRSGLQRIWEARLTAEARSKPHAMVETRAQLRPAHA